jgi:hypothetical protein
MINKVEAAIASIQNEMFNEGRGFCDPLPAMLKLYYLENLLRWLRNEKGDK